MQTWHVVCDNCSPGSSAHPTITREIMSSTKMTAGTAALIAVAWIVGIFSIGTGVYEQRKSHQARLALKAAALQYAAGQEHQRALLRAVSAAETTLAGLQKDLARLTALNPAEFASATTRAASRAGAGGPAGPAARAVSTAEWQSFATAFPEVRNMLAQVHQSQFERSYGKFMAGLTPAQAQAFESATVDLWDQSEGMAANGGFHPTVNQLPDDQLRAILGDQGFQQLQTYNQMMPANYLASNVWMATGSSGVPISPDQQQQLAQIVADNSPSFENGGRVNLTSVNWDTAATQAQAVLSSAQWPAAQSILLNYQYQLALFQARRAAP